MEESQYRASRLLKELGVPTRYQIVKLLEKGSLAVGEIAVALDRSVHAISHHLHILRAIDVVHYDRAGKNAIYRLKATRVPDLLSLAERCAAELEFKGILGSLTFNSCGHVHESLCVSREHGRPPALLQ